MHHDDREETRQERRERKLKARRERMPAHGAGLRRNVVDAALKMARKRIKRIERR
jgi:hypothetical protein